MHSTRKEISYQLHIFLSQPARIRIGALGEFDFPAGHYLYTGSARRNLETRIQRHLSREKKLHWHIDYLLQHPAAKIRKVSRSAMTECSWNQATPGNIPAPGFGASDCKTGCGAHLKWTGKPRKSG